MDTQTLLWTLTWCLAVAGALLSAAAAWAKAKRRVSARTAERMNLGSYVLLGLSLGLFVLRGFIA